MSKEIIWENGIKTVRENIENVSEDKANLAIELERRTMECTPLQGKLALGQDRWMIIEDFLSNYATWEQQQIVANASVWKRNSPSIAVFKNILQLTDEELDKMFKQASKLDV